MLKNNYLLYSEYFKKRDVQNKSIMIAQTANSYLIGPLINSNFYEESFYKRIKSNSIYTTKIYKKVSKRKANILINKYKNNMKSNQIIELYKNGEKVLHLIVKVPGEDDGKK